jgi:hypothetical protein
MNPALLPLLDIAVQNEVERIKQRKYFDYYEELTRLRDFEYPHPHIDGEVLTAMDYLTFCSDVFICGSSYPKDKGVAAKVFSILAQIIAVASFAPGGIAMFGNRWENYHQKNTLK